MKNSYCYVVVPSEEAGDGIRQVRSVSSHKVRNEKRCLAPFESRLGLDSNTSNNKLNNYNLLNIVLLYDPLYC